MADDIDSSERFVLLNRLAEEFAERYRRGERPGLKDYVDRHPELAADIEEFFPAMVQMEQVKEDREERTGAARLRSARALGATRRLPRHPRDRTRRHGRCV
jgi:hypothetical protein